jgi:hypothetical protein
MNVVSTVASANRRIGEARKHFFFEKRNKKLLFPYPTPPMQPARIQIYESFLVLFFKKELLS